MRVDVYYEDKFLSNNDILGILTEETKLYGNTSTEDVMNYSNIDIYANNDRRLRVVIRTPELQIVNLQNATGVLTVKVTKKDTSFVFQKNTSNPEEGMIGAADEGECFFFIKDIDTKNIKTGQYIYDIRVTLADGKSYTVVDGVMNLLMPVNS
jgi:hypothetical protein